jgi:hypothetical protein
MLAVEIALFGMPEMRQLELRFRVTSSNTHLSGVMLELPHVTDHCRMLRTRPPM